MKKLLVLLFLLCCCPRPGHAEVFSTDYFVVDLPEAWQSLHASNDNSISISVFATKTRDSTLTTVVGSTDGADLETITNCFAQQYQASRKPTFKKNLGTFSYRSSLGGDGTGYVSMDDTVYMVVTISGNQRKGRSFLRTFTSKDYDNLIPAP